MMAFPSMLIDAAEQAGMKVPPDVDDFEPEDFPHFHVFCILQLARPMQWGEHWENAKIIAAFDETKLKQSTLEEFIEAGLQYSS